MDEVLKILVATTGGLGTLVGVAYAVLKILREDDGWEKLNAAKDAEIKRKDEEIARLNALLRKEE